MGKNEYNIEYDRNNCKQYKLKLNIKTDSKLIEILDSLPNKQGYFKALIISDNKKTFEKL